VLLRGPLRQLSVLPDIFRLIPLLLLPFLRRTLVDVGIGSICLIRPFDPASERGLVPAIGCCLRDAIPLWRMLVYRFREGGCLTFVEGLGAEIGFRRLPDIFVPFAVVNDDARAFVAEAVVLLKPLPPGFFPRFEFVGDACCDESTKP
jgi:hypothetical protein